MAEPRTDFVKLGGVVFLLAGILWISGGGLSDVRLFGVDGFVLGSLLFFCNSLLFFALGSKRLRKHLDEGR